MPDIGVDFGGNKVDALAYAGDRPERLQGKLTGLEEALLRRGMGIKIKKSASLTIAKDGKRKCLVLVPRDLLTADGVIAPMGVASVQKYLGLNLTWKGKVNLKHMGRLDEMLKEVSAAPLKPFQRLEIMRTPTEADP